MRYEKLFIDILELNEKPCVGIYFVGLLFDKMKGLIEREVFELHQIRYDDGRRSRYSFIAVNEYSFLIAEVMI